MTYRICQACHGDGLNPHGNECEFCDGYGEVEDREDDWWSDMGFEDINTEEKDKPV